MKNILVASLFSISLIFNGCGDSEGEAQLEIQQMLDNADYRGVISKLEGSASSSEDYIALGAAYMGKAGLSLGDIVSAMASEDDSNNDDGFGSFVEKISNKSNSTAIVDLGKANINYKEIVGDQCKDENLTLSDSQKDICLYITLANTSRAAVTIDALADDVSKIAEDGSSDEKLTASTCAMQYAFNGTSSDCTITDSDDVNFTMTGRIYTPLVVRVNADIDSPKSEYHYLMSDANRTVLTKGFCALDSFTPRVDDYSSSLYACPINEDKDEDELTAVGLLTTVLNDGIDSIGGAASSDDITADIDEFKCDILGGNYDEFNGCNDANGTVNTSQEISEQQIIDYLNRENN